MADVFISYARDDEPVARRLAKAFAAAGHDVWWDAQLPAHRAYSDEIERNLRAARAVVVLWSSRSANSQWVRAEADFARNAGKLVQAQLDDSLPPLPFNQIQCADLRGWRGSDRHAGWAKLRASAEALLAGEEAVVPADAVPPRRLRLLLFAVLALALLAGIGALLVPKMLSADEERPVLAVLPFKSLSPGDESLVGGIWEDTRSAISRNPQLLVLGPHTSEQLAARGAKAARKSADYLLEASVRSAGDRIRLTANLVRTDDGSSVWSERFDRRLDDIFALQAELAQEIEGRIRGRLAERGGVQPHNIATSTEVYALYSDARATIRKREGAFYAQALEQLERVVQMDPNYAPGWATLAVARGFGFGPQAGSTGAETAARRAIALAPNLAAGHAALGFALRKGPAAEAALRRALSLDPSDIEAMNWLANSLDDDRVEEKLELYSRAAEIEPLWWPAVLNKLNILITAGNDAAVASEVARAEQAGDEMLTALIRMYIAEKRRDLSTIVKIGVAHYRRSSPQEQEFLAALLFQPLLQLGQFEIADRIFPIPLDYIPHIRNDDPAAIEMIEADMEPRRFWTFGPLSIPASRVYLRNGEGPRLAARYKAAAASPDVFEQLVGQSIFPDIAPSVALALRSAGDEAQVQELLQRAERLASDSMSEPSDRQVRLARIYAVQGKRDQAMGLLIRAVGSGWLPPYMPVHTDIALDPPLAELRQDPRFESVRQQILSRLERERAELGTLNLN